MKVESYKLYTSNGRYIRTATKVILNDGKEIKFLDKMSKTEAIFNANALILTHKLHAANKAALNADQAARKLDTDEAWDERARAYDAATAAQIALDDATYSRK